MFFTTFLKEHVWLVVFLLAAAYFLLLIRSDIIQDSRLEREKRALISEMENESVKQKGMKTSLSALKNSSFVETLAREKLGLVRRGESAYKVIFK